MISSKWFILICNLLTSVKFVTSLFWSSSNATVYPLCKKYQDNNKGDWISVSDIKTEEQNAEVLGHFFGEGPGEAMKFTEIWLPKKCSYHRFTNKTFSTMIKQLTDNIPEKAIHIGVFGDSGTRNTICGLTRILAGSERNGPCRNRICGNENTKRISVEEAYQPFQMKLMNSKFIITFYYIFGFNSRSKETFNVLHKFLESSSTKPRPYAVIVNTGIYDFVKSVTYGKSYYQGCETMDEMERSLNRARPEVIKELLLLSAIAKKKNIRLIYRTNHINRRYGALCADGPLEVKMKGMKDSIWEIWDNRALSKDVWKKQTYDGFHYGRPHTHSTEDHHRYRKEYRSKFHEDPGQLEIQLAQSLLHNLFYDYIEKKFRTKYGELTSSGIDEDENEEEIDGENEDMINGTLLNSSLINQTSSVILKN